MTTKQKCLMYAGVYLKLKQEKIWNQSVICHWFSYIQLKDRFKIDKKNYDFENGEIEFGVELCKNDDHITVKVFKLY